MSDPNILIQEAQKESTPRTSRAHTDHSIDQGHQREEQKQPERQDDHGENGAIPETMPDTFADFIADGDAQTAPANFLAGILKKATDTLETSLQQAQQTSTEALSTAQTAGSSAFSAVSGIVRDIGNGLADSSQSSPPVAGFAATTRSMKSFRVPSVPVLFLPPAGAICTSSVCSISPSGRPVEKSISPDLSHIVAVHATCAARMPDAQVILGLESGGLRVLSLAGPVAALVHETATESSRATALSVGDNVVAVGSHHGYTNVLSISDLSAVKTVTPPDLCAVQLGAAFRYAPVSCLTVSKDAFLLIGYDDGAVKFSNMADDFVGASFVAHSRRVSDILLFYDALAVTIGDGTDPSMAVFDAYTGRCLVRRMLPYAPRSLTISRSNQAHEEGLICPSEMTFMVAGEEGQVEAFRLVVMSPKKVELHLVKTFSDRVRGKNRAVIETVYVPEQAVLFALAVNGELRRWQLSKEDGCNLALLGEELSIKPAFTEANIVTAADQDFSLPDGSRLNSVGGVIKAQNILATILDDERFPETDKDRLVSDFQHRQAEMLVATSQGDTELRRARRRIVARFDAGLRASNTTGTTTDVQLAKAAKRTAVFEIEFATRRHAESLTSIQQSAMADLKSILQNFIKRLPITLASSSEGIRRDVDILGREDTEIE